MKHDGRDSQRAVQASSGPTPNVEAVDRVRELLPKLEKLAAEGDVSPQLRPLHKREAPTLSAVIDILTDGRPMRAIDIHAAVQRARGKSMPWSTVKDCLTSNARQGRATCADCPRPIRARYFH